MKISKWSGRWEIPFNVTKCHILQVITRNQTKKNYVEMNGAKREGVQCVKDLDVATELNLNSLSNAKMLRVKLLKFWAL